MASYVNRKDRVFSPAGDCPPLQRHRPEAALKSYISCTDTRVWELAEEPRRQYLRDILNTPLGLQLGNYVPVESLIDILMSPKSQEEFKEAKTCCCKRKTKCKENGTQSIPCKPTGMSKEEMEKLLCDKDAQLKILKCHIERLESELNCEKHRASEKSKELEDLVRELCEKNKELCEKTRMLNNKNRELNEQAQAATEATRNLQEAQQQLRERTEGSQTIVAKESRDFEKLYEEIQCLRLQLDAAMKSQCEAEYTAQCLLNENQGLKRELCNCHQTLADQSSKLAEMRCALDTAQQDSRCKEKEICKLQEELEYVKIKLKEASLRNEDDKYKAQSDSVAEEKARKYKAKFKELEAQVRELTCTCGTKNRDEQRALQAVTAERDCLLQKLEQLSGVENAYNSVRGQLNDMQNVIAERDRLRMKLLNYSAVDEDVERLRYKVCQLQQRVDELEIIESQYKELVESSKDLEKVKTEREQLKCKINELMNANYAKQRRICGMEEELKKLIKTIDRMAEEEAKCKQENELICLTALCESQNRKLEDYQKKIRELDEVRVDLNEVQEEIITTIDEFQFQQHLNETLLTRLRTEQESNVVQLEENVQFLQALSKVSNMDLIKTLIRTESLKLVTEMTSKKEHFSITMQDISKLHDTMASFLGQFADKNFQKVLDTTHLEYNRELVEMETQLHRNEQEIKTLENLLKSRDDQFVDIVKLVTSIDAKREEISLAQKEIECYKGPGKNLEMRLEKYECDIKRLEHKLLEEESHSIMTIIREIEKRRDDIERTENEIAKLNQLYLNKKQERNDCSADRNILNDITKLNKEIEIAQREMGNLKEQLVKPAFLVETYQKYYSELSALQCAMEKFKMEVAQLKQKKFDGKSVDDSECNCCSLEMEEEECLLEVERLEQLIKDQDQQCTIKEIGNEIDKRRQKVVEIEKNLKELRSAIYESDNRCRVESTENQMSKHPADQCLAEDDTEVTILIHQIEKTHQENQLLEQHLHQIQNVFATTTPNENLESLENNISTMQQEIQSLKFLLQHIMKSLSLEVPEEALQNVSSIPQQNLDEIHLQHTTQVKKLEEIIVDKAIEVRRLEKLLAQTSNTDTIHQEYNLELKNLENELRQYKQEVKALENLLDQRENEKHLVVMNILDAISKKQEEKHRTIKEIEVIKAKSNKSGNQITSRLDKPELVRNQEYNWSKMDYNSVLRNSLETIKDTTTKPIDNESLIKFLVSPQKDIKTEFSTQTEQSQTLKPPPNNPTSNVQLDRYAQLTEEDDLFNLILGIENKKRDIDSQLWEIEKIKQSDTGNQVQENIAKIVKLTSEIHTLEDEIKKSRVGGNVFKQIAELQNSISVKQEKICSINSNVLSMSEGSEGSGDQLETIQTFLVLIKNLQNEIVQNQVAIDHLFDVIQVDNKSIPEYSKELQGFEKCLWKIEELKLKIGEKEKEISECTRKIDPTDCKEVERIINKVKENSKRIRELEDEIIEIIQRFQLIENQSGEVIKYIKEIQRLAIENIKNEEIVKQIQNLPYDTIEQVKIIQNRIRRNKILMSTFSSVIISLPPPIFEKVNDHRFTNAINTLQFLITNNEQKRQKLERNALNAQNEFKNTDKFETVQNKMTAVQNSIDMYVTELFEFIQKLPKNDRNVSVYLNEIKNLQVKSLEDVTKIQTILDVAKSLNVDEVEYLNDHITATMDLQKQIRCYRRESKVVLNMVKSSIECIESTETDCLFRIQEIIKNIYHAHATFESYQSHFIELLEATSAACSRVEIENLIREGKMFEKVIETLCRIENLTQEGSTVPMEDVEELECVFGYLQGKCNKLEEPGQILGKYIEVMSRLEIIINDLRNQINKPKTEDKTLIENLTSTIESLKISTNPEDRKYVNDLLKIIKHGQSNEAIIEKPQSQIKNEDYEKFISAIAELNGNSFETEASVIENLMKIMDKFSQHENDSEYLKKILSIIENLKRKFTETANNYYTELSKISHQLQEKYFDLSFVPKLVGLVDCLRKNKQSDESLFVEKLSNLAKELQSRQEIEKKEYVSRLLDIIEVFKESRGQDYVESIKDLLELIDKVIKNSIAPEELAFTEHLLGVLDEMNQVTQARENRMMGSGVDPEDKSQEFLGYPTKKILCDSQVVTTDSETVVQRMLYTDRLLEILDTKTKNIGLNSPELIKSVETFESKYTEKLLNLIDLLQRKSQARFPSKITDRNELEEIKEEHDYLITSQSNLVEVLEKARSQHEQAKRDLVSLEQARSEEIEELVAEKQMLEVMCAKFQQQLEDQDKEASSRSLSIQQDNQQLQCLAQTRETQLQLYKEQLDVCQEQCNQLYSMLQCSEAQRKQCEDSNQELQTIIKKCDDVIACMCQDGHLENLFTIMNDCIMKINEKLKEAFCESNYWKKMVEVHKNQITTLESNLKSVQKELKDCNEVTKNEIINTIDRMDRQLESLKSKSNINVVDLSLENTTQRSIRRESPKESKGSSKAKSEQSKGAKVDPVVSKPITRISSIPGGLLTDIKTNQISFKTMVEEDLEKPSDIDTTAPSEVEADRYRKSTKDVIRTEIESHVDKTVAGLRGSSKEVEFLDKDRVGTLRGSFRKPSETMETGRESKKSSLTKSERKSITIDDTKESSKIVEIIEDPSDTRSIRGIPRSTIEEPRRGSLRGSAIPTDIPTVPTGSDTLIDEVSTKSDIQSILDKPGSISKSDEPAYNQVRPEDEIDKFTDRRESKVSAGKNISMVPSIDDKGQPEDQTWEESKKLSLKPQDFDAKKIQIDEKIRKESIVSEFGKDKLPPSMGRKGSKPGSLVDSVENKEKPNELEKRFSERPPSTPSGNNLEDCKDDVDRLKNELAMKEKLLKEAEENASKNMENLTKQYERNSKLLLEKHNESVAKLMEMQDETMKKLTENNDHLQEQVEDLMHRLAKCEIGHKEIEGIKEDDEGKERKKGDDENVEEPTRESSQLFENEKIKGIDVRVPSKSSLKPISDKTSKIEKRKFDDVTTDDAKKKKIELTPSGLKVSFPQGELSQARQKSTAKIGSKTKLEIVPEQEIQRKSRTSTTLLPTPDEEGKSYSVEKHFVDYDKVHDGQDYKEDALIHPLGKKSDIVITASQSKKSDKDGSRSGVRSQLEPKGMDVGKRSGSQSRGSTSRESSVERKDQSKQRKVSNSPGRTPSKKSNISNPNILNVTVDRNIPQGAKRSKTSSGSVVSSRPTKQLSKKGEVEKSENTGKDFVEPSSDVNKDAPNVEQFFPPNVIEEGKTEPIRESKEDIEASSRVIDSKPMIPSSPDKLSIKPSSDRPVLKSSQPQRKHSADSKLATESRIEEELTQSSLLKTQEKSEEEIVDKEKTTVSKKGEDQHAQELSTLERKQEEEKTKRLISPPNASKTIISKKGEEDLNAQELSTLERKQEEEQRKRLISGPTAEKEEGEKMKTTISKKGVEDPNDQELNISKIQEEKTKGQTITPKLRKEKEEEEVKTTISKKGVEDSNAQELYTSKTQEEKTKGPKITPKLQKEKEEEARRGISKKEEGPSDQELYASKIQEDKIKRTIDGPNIKMTSDDPSDLLSSSKSQDEESKVTKDKQEIEDPNIDVDRLKLRDEERISKIEKKKSSDSSKIYEPRISLSKRSSSAELKSSVDPNFPQSFIPKVIPEEEEDESFAVRGSIDTPKSGTQKSKEEDPSKKSYVDPAYDLSDPKSSSSKRSSSADSASLTKRKIEDDEKSKLRQRSKSATEAHEKPGVSSDFPDIPTSPDNLIKQLSAPISPKYSYKSKVPLDKIDEDDGSEVRKSPTEEAASKSYHESRRPKPYPTYPPPKRGLRPGEKTNFWECLCRLDKVQNTGSMVNILNKFLYQGLDKLDICELSKLHGRICKAASSLADKDKEGDEETQLRHRIRELEAELKQKQKSAQDKMRLLEASLREERERISQMREAIHSKEPSKPFSTDKAPVISSCGPFPPRQQSPKPFFSSQENSQSTQYNVQQPKPCCTVCCKTNRKRNPCCSCGASGKGHSNKVMMEDEQTKKFVTKCAKGFQKRKN